MGHHTYVLLSAVIRHMQATSAANCFSLADFRWNRLTYVQLEATGPSLCLIIIGKTRVVWEEIPAEIV